MNTNSEEQLWEIAQTKANQERYGEAEAILNRIREQFGDGETVQFFLGEMVRLQGRLQQAFGHYQQAVRLDPGYSPACMALATMYLQQGMHSEAFLVLKPLLAVESKAINTVITLVNRLLQAKELIAARNYCKESLAIIPGSFQLYFLLAETARISGDLAQAVSDYLKAIELNPRCDQACNNLGVIYQHQGYQQKAGQQFVRALSIVPDNIDYMVNLAGSYTKQKKLADAVSFLQSKLKKYPDSAPLQGCMARALQDIGQQDEALSYYRDAFSGFGAQAVSAVDFSDFHSSYVFFHNYPAGLTKEQVYKAHQEWEALHGGGGKRWPQDYAWHYAPERPESAGSHHKLRMGYVSADFYHHSVAYFLLPLLSQHNKDKFTVTCYMNAPHHDAVTQKIQACSDRWRNIMGDDAVQVANRIREDEIDVLVDLSGHTAGNRMDVFALKPAPVQITWLGYPNTTGLSAMDYRITDVWADPEGEERWHSEELVRMPHGFLCYNMPADAPAVAALPAVRNGYITYGSFNNLSKHNDTVITLWSRLLNAQPRARLIIKNASLDDALTARTIRQRFMQYGIDRQLELVGRIPDQLGHLGAYGRIDIALDTFPYNGTTTTCEALWMGVPVITLAGDRHAARVGMSLLKQIRHSEWVAENDDEYIHKAIALAEDIEKLAEIRQTLRAQVQSSSLGDARSFCREFEKVVTMLYRLGRSNC